MAYHGRLRLEAAMMLSDLELCLGCFLGCQKGIDLKLMAPGQNFDIGNEGMTSLNTDKF